MPDFNISIDIYLLFLLLAAAAGVGFLLRSSQLRRKNREIVSLERDMMQANTELLEIQRDYCELRDQVKGNSDSPVIPLEVKPKEPAKQSRR